MSGYPSQVTFFSIHPPLSMFALFVNLAKEHFNYWAIETICFVTICYLSLCSYYTVSMTATAAVH
jgi:hypothetical protein